MVPLPSPCLPPMPYIPGPMRVRPRRQLTNAGLTLLLIPLCSDRCGSGCWTKAAILLESHTSFGAPSFIRDYLAKLFSCIWATRPPPGHFGMGLALVTGSQCPIFMGTLSLHGPVDLDRVPARHHRSLGHRRRPIKPPRHRLRHGCDHVHRPDRPLPRRPHGHATPCHPTISPPRCRSPCPTAARRNGRTARFAKHKERTGANRSAGVRTEPAEAVVVASRAHC